MSPHCSSPSPAAGAQRSQPLPAQESQREGTAVQTEVLEVQRLCHENVMLLINISIIDTLATTA